MDGRVSVGSVGLVSGWIKVCSVIISFMTRRLAISLSFTGFLQHISGSRVIRVDPILYKYY